ncbi:ABC transporter ATP-binding protein [Furfurilactobacillus entadae]|uniref:ABC transporter ATP-binding protein n=1 Tax=Furfurilactobacillus entadae TaxID=2922307 RepID=UPI0035EECB51
MSLINLDHVTFYYDAQQQPVLNDQSLDVFDGTFNLLTGPSGTGKSTFLKLVAGLYPAFTGHQEQGHITIAGQDVNVLAPNDRTALVAMMFQNPGEQFAMPTPREELVFALENQQLNPAVIPDKVRNALAFANVADLADRQFTTLSGGEQQKVSLALIVALESRVILLDEPFANVDPEARTVLLDRLSELATNHHKTILIADHDLSDYRDRIDQLYVLDPTRQQIHPATVTETATRFTDFAAHAHQPQSLSPVVQTASEFDLNELTVGHQTPLLTATSLSLFQAQLTVITGANGTGKSTLLNALARLQPYTGTITWRQTDLNKIRRQQYAKHVALVFQQASSQFLRITVAEELALSQTHQVSTEWTPAKVDATLSDLGLADLLDRVVYTLSEGQKKKLQLLLMLIMGTDTLLLDEPLTGLDLTSTHQMLQLLHEAVHQHGHTIIMITHQLTDVVHYADRHIHLINHQLHYEASL